MGVNQDILITTNNAKSLLLIIYGHIQVPLLWLIKGF